MAMKPDWLALIEDWLGEYLPVGVLVVDRNGVVQYWNAWLEIHSGLTPEEVVGRPLAEIFPDLPGRRESAALRRVMADGESIALSYRLHHYFLRLPTSFKKLFPYMVQNTLLAPLRRQGEIAGTVVVIQDVSEHVAAEMEAQERIKALNHAQEMAAKAHQALERLHLDLTVRNRLAAALVKSLQVPEVIQTALDIILPELGYEAGVIFIGDGDQDDSWAASARRHPPSPEPPEPLLGLTQAQAQALARRARSVYCEDLSQEAPQGDGGMTPATWGSLVSVPLLLGDATAGALLLANRQATKLDTIQEELLFALGDQVAVALDNARMHQALRDMAQRDSLTGLYNHAYLHERLAQELSLAQRRQQCLAFLMMDLDNFKNFNDTYGHQMGDTVLKMAAQVLRQTIRLEDTIGRYGGEEFAVILPSGHDLEEGVRAAERIRANIANQEIPGLPPNVRVTLSIGVAVYPDHSSSERELIAAADAAMYQAKKNGRNRVETAAALTSAEQPFS